VEHLIDVPGRDEAIVEPAKVEQFELVRRTRLVLGVLNVDAPNPVASVHKILDQVMPYEAACSRHQYTCRHVEPPESLLD
jgi:hypothetical protein